jgi:hypothetical protein
MRFYTKQHQHLCGIPEPVQIDSMSGRSLPAGVGEMHSLKSFAGKAGGGFGSAGSIHVFRSRSHHRQTRVAMAE